MLNRSGVPYLVGGTYAFQYYAGISRTTKDIDIFVRPRDVRRVLDVLTRCGFKTEIAFHHWLAKAHHGEKFIDVIFSSGNGLAEVDDEWFAHAVDETVLATPVKLVPVTGRVTYKDEPVTAGTITFHPDPTNSYTKDSPSRTPMSR